MRAFQLQQRWNSASPQPLRRRHITKARTRVIALQFIEISGRPHLVSVSIVEPAASGQRILECWDLSVEPPICVARRHLTNPRGSGFFTLNQEYGNAAVLALRLADSVEILGIRPDPTTPSRGFGILADIHKRVSALYKLSGNTIVSKGPTESDPVTVWRYTHPEAEVALRSPSPEAIAEVLLDRNYIVALRSRSLVVYSSSSAAASRLINPIFVHTFQWSIDSCIMNSQILNPSISSISRSEADISFINILVRFSSGFPWPVNVIHHYTLHLPPPRLSSSGPISSGALPDPILTLQQVISAPIRLFGISDMTIGAFGTGIWIDTHTEDYFTSIDGQAVGQRLVGLPLRRASSSTPASNGGVPSSVASTTFQVNDERQCSWVKLAVDEQEGRLGVADSDGNITVYEYV